MQHSDLTLDRDFDSSPAHAATGADVAPQRLLFFGLCFYVLSQAYQIPLAAVGPSWTLWPRFTDLAIAFLALGALWEFAKGQRLPQPHRPILLWLIIFIWFAVLSVVVSTLLLPRLSSVFPRYPQAFQWGAYQLVRMVQFAVVFVAASLLHITPRRKRWLTVLTALVLLFLCVSIVGNYLGFISHESIVAHLPNDKTVAGPWALFGSEGDGLGTVGYNHAYSACQVMLAFAFFFCLTERRLSLVNGSLVLASLLAVLLTGSRAGFGSMLVFAAVCVALWVGRGYFMTLLWSAAALAGLGMVLVMLPGDFLGPYVHQVEQANNVLLSRQRTTFQGYQSKNLSGRAEIWNSRIQYLNDEPYRWIVGAGFGSAAVSGRNAHMMPLNAVVEIGVIGLLIGSIAFYYVGVQLWRLEPPGRPFFWGSLAIGVTCLTQETFYPVPAMGHYLGFFLCCLAVILNMAAGEHQPPAAESSPHTA